MSRGACERSDKEYEEAGIDRNKFQEPLVEFEENVDPDSLIHLSDDPIMQQAEETMMSVDEYSTGTSAEELERYKDEVYEKYSGASVDDSAQEDTAAVPQEEQPDEVPQEKEASPEQADDTPSGDSSYDELDDIDLDSINRLISELTGNEE